MLFLLLYIAASMHFFHIKRNVSCTFTSVQFLFVLCVYVCVNFVRLPLLYITLDIQNSARYSILRMPRHFLSQRLRRNCSWRVPIVVDVFHLSYGLFRGDLALRKPWHILLDETRAPRYHVILKETFFIVSLRPIIFQNNPRRNFIPWQIGTACRGIGRYDRNTHGNPFALAEFSNHRCNLFVSHPPLHRSRFKFKGHDCVLRIVVCWYHDV